MKVLLIGLSHKTAPIEIRERLNFAPHTLRAILTHFDATHHRLAHLEDVREGVVLSTCNRLEVYALVRDAEMASREIIDLLSRSCETAVDVFNRHHRPPENSDLSLTHRPARFSRTAGGRR